jgi:Fe-S cluster biogenesis protein NfuA
MSEIENRIVAVIDKIRPFLISDGGNIEFVKFEDGIVYIRMMGHCSNCQLIDFTLHDGIEIALINEIPEVVGVKNISDMS